MPKKKTKPPSVSPYKILSDWIYDGNKNSEMPEDLKNDKAIGSQFVLYFFRGSKYFHFIESMFNNYDVFQLNKFDVFRFIKSSVRSSGYRQRYLSSFKDSKSKLATILKKKYPVLKYDDVNLLVDIIDNGEMKDLVYETLGLKKAKKSKVKKSDLKKGKKSKKEIKNPKLDNSSLQGVMSSFQIEEIS